jgi:L-lactate dehydrogenase (cytochrome)
MAEVAKHNTIDDCWLVLHGKAYDLSAFHKAHPGGSKLITMNAGKDATGHFSMIHPPDMMDKLLGPEDCKGEVDGKTIKPEHLGKQPKKRAKPPPKPAQAQALGPIAAPEPWTKPPLAAILNLYDMEAVAQRVMEPEGWGYYSSGGDDEITLRENRRAYQRIYFKPRILINVKEISLARKILGFDSQFPFYFTAPAMAGLANKEGECGIVRAAHRNGVIYMRPTLSSQPLAEMLKAMAPGQVCFAQLYVNPVRSRSEAYIKQLEAGGVKALFATVDAPQLGRRERDMRNKVTAASNVQDEAGDEADKSQGVARAISSFIDPGFCWEDVGWLRRTTNLPIFLKGVQSAEDAVMALRAGVDGIVCSNHGGRQLDTARSGIEILAEVMPALQAVGYDPSNFHVLCDGGVRRASDVVKAIALGAEGIGMGRPVLYSYAAYGPKGIDRMCNFLRDEMIMVMRLLGTPSMKEVTRDRVLLRGLTDAEPASDMSADRNYLPMPSPAYSKL